MKCPECGRDITHVINDKHFTGKPVKRIIDRPIKNDDGSYNIKNLIYMDPSIVLIIIGLILLLLGFRQINQQCYDILETPCKLVEQYGCCRGMNGVLLNNSMVNKHLVNIKIANPKTP